MKLNRLEMYGFKSFANKTEIEFGNGITGIVGPNGSGKSNISDAIRWVLGEQNVRNIRGNQITDVIFKGSKTKHASGIAEVLLTFDNENTIPVDFQEISIKRRIFRTGESEFYINKSRCRLKDITDLFADTGIGLGGISIISQNRVDDILKAKPEDRRIFFEETIGITKYRNRKRETLNKIEETQSNLNRASDIINELKTQLEPLSIQAERTNKYNLLENERHKLKLVKYQKKFNQLSEEFDKYSQIQIELNDKSLEIKSKISIEESEKEKINKEIVDIEHEIIKQSEKNEEIRQKIENNSQEITKLTEKQSNGNSNLENIKKNQVKLSNEINSTLDDLTSIKSTLQKQREELQNQQNLIKNTQRNLEEIEILSQNQTSQKREFEKSTIKLQKELTNLKNESLIIEHDLKTFEKNKETFKDNETKILNELKELNIEFQDSKFQNESIKEEIKSIKNQQNDLNILLKIESEINKNYQLEKEKNLQKVNSLSSRFQILQKMQQNYEGFAKAPKSILMSKEFWRNKIYGAVGELLKVSSKYSIAIEVALGGNLQNIVTEGEETAKLAIEFLKREKLGRVTFLPLTRISNYATLKKIEEVGVIDFANNLVETDEKLRKIADFLLSRTLIVDNIDNALKISRRHNIKIVTLAGEVLNIGGSISGGFTRQNESNIINRNGEIENLKNELNISQKHFDESKKNLNLSDEKIKNINGNINLLNDRLNLLNIKEAETRLSIKQLEKLIDDKQKDLSKFQNSLYNQANSINEMIKRRDELQNELISINKNLNICQGDLKNVNEKLSKTQNEYNNVNKKLKKLEIDFAVYEQKIIRTESQIEMLQAKVESDEYEIKNQKLQERNLLKSLSDYAVKLSKLNKENEIVATQYSYAKEQSQINYSKKMKKLSKIAELDKNIREFTGIFNKNKNQIHEIELEINRLRMLISEIEIKIKEELKNEEHLPDLNLDEVFINKRLKEIEIAITEIGAINPNAPKEFEELNNRYEFLNGQFQDLTTAKNNLKALIEEIDSQIVKNFLEAFEKIQILFSEVFIKLFGGGIAQLELTDKEDILNSGVEIMVTLPNKKRQSLSVLSGGERALTVTALLFAFLKFRPSPFCILDEIDAPLDEANLIRFGNFLRELSVNTQFILITHRKTTMEFLDRIYGITIEETGISKILSIKLQ